MYFSCFYQSTGSLYNILDQLYLLLNHPFFLLFEQILLLSLNGFLYILIKHVRNTTFHFSLQVSNKFTNNNDIYMNRASF